jgi:hypothetical protein
MDAAKPRQVVVPSAPPPPLVLVIGCPATFVASCHESGGRLGVVVKECDLRSIRAAVSVSQPFAVIVTEDVYQSDAGTFDEVVRQAPASLVRLDSKHAADAASELLVDAIFESAATGPGSGVRPILG